MRVSVTGGTGFVGRALVRRLLAQGDQVRVLARPSPRADALEKLGVEIVRGDITDRDAVSRAVQGAEVVYHAAAKVSGSGTRKEFIDTNFGGTDCVLEASLAHRVSRLVHLSSIAVYGLAPEGHRIDETTPFDDRPGDRDSYAQSKILADLRATQFAKQTGLPITILREGLVYGPGRPLPIALLGFRAGKMNFLFSSGRLHFPLNYVENLVDAMLRVSQASDTRAHQYVLLDDDDLTLGAYHRVREAVEGGVTFFPPGWPVLATAGLVDAARLGLSIGRRQGASFSAYQVKRALQDRHYDSSLIRRETGWSPRVPLRQALASTLSANDEAATSAR